METRQHPKLPFCNVEFQKYPQYSQHHTYTHTITGCAQCSRTSIILEALFGRIHTLEKQLEQCCADKDAANRTLLRVLDARTARKPIGDKTSDFSSTFVESSSQASLSRTSKRSTRSSTEPGTNNDEPAPLIDLLGPLDCPNEPLVGSAATEDADGDAPSSSEPCDGLEFQGSPHTRRFNEKDKEHEKVTQAAGSFAPDVVPMDILESPSLVQIESMSKTGKLAFFQKELIYPTSDDADSEHSQNIVSLKPSFSSGPEPPIAQSDLADRTSRAKTCSAPFTPTGIRAPKHYCGLNYSQRAPGNDPAPKGLSSSPEARWEQYCQTVDVRHVNGKLLEKSSLNRFDSKTMAVKLFIADTMAQQGRG